MSCTSKLCLNILHELDLQQRAGRCDLLCKVIVEGQVQLLRVKVRVIDHFFVPKKPNFFGVVGNY